VFAASITIVLPFLQRYIVVITICLKAAKKQIRILTAVLTTRHNIKVTEARVKLTVCTVNLLAFFENTDLLINCACKAF
jgi:hypothetical protein